MDVNDGVGGGREGEAGPMGTLRGVILTQHTRANGRGQSRSGISRGTVLHPSLPTPQSSDAAFRSGHASSAQVRWSLTHNESCACWICMRGFATLQKERPQRRLTLRQRYIRPRTTFARCAFFSFFHFSNRRLLEHFLCKLILFIDWIHYSK